MDPPRRKKSLAPRSRSGCLECRRHHRKCDELRPVCSICRINGRKCEYGLRITWGGRAFRKSTFGRCIEETSSAPQRGGPVVVKLQSVGQDEHGDPRVPPSFVYGLSLGGEPDAETCTTSIEDSSPVLPTTSHVLGLCSSSVDVEMLMPQFMAIRAAPSWLPDIPAPYRFLLDYFTQVTHSFSCDEVVQRHFCGTFMPIAIETSHVMASMLALAATHRINAGLDQDPKQLALLQSVVAEQLRIKISTNFGHPTESTLATILMLCYSDIVSGEKTGKSWRTHLEGAASILAQNTCKWAIRSSDPTRAFIARCFVSLVALANCSANPPSEMVSAQAMALATGAHEAPYIDEFTAYDPNLVGIFCEIGSLLRACNHTFGVTRRPSLDVEKRARNLILRVQTRMDESGFMGVNVDVLSDVSAARKLDYLRINESYHQAALIQLYQRILRNPPSAGNLQQAVKRILELLCDVEMAQGPCPGTVMLFPIFSAGCAAIHAADKIQVRAVLNSMMEKYKIGNVKHCLELLEAIWSSGHRNAIAWPDFAGKCHARDLAKPLDPCYLHFAYFVTSRWH